MRPETEDFRSDCKEVVCARILPFPLYSVFLPQPSKSPRQCRTRRGVRKPQQPRDMVGEVGDPLVPVKLLKIILAPTQHGPPTEIWKGSFSTKFQNIFTPKTVLFRSISSRSASCFLCMGLGKDFSHGLSFTNPYGKKNRKSPFCKAKRKRHWLKGAVSDLVHFFFNGREILNNLLNFLAFKGISKPHSWGKTLNHRVCFSPTKLPQWVTTATHLWIIRIIP